MIIPQSSKPIKTDPNSKSSLTTTLHVNQFIMSLTQDDIISFTAKALNYASENLFSKSEELLTYLLEHFPGTGEVSFQELTILNNLAFIHHKSGNNYKSLTFISRAQMFKPQTDQDLSYYIATLLNMSSINSSLSSHQSALQQAFKAVELCEGDKFPELKALAYYNLSTILVTLNRIEKAGFYFRETNTIARTILGSKHKLTLLSHKASSACLNPESFHIRVKSSGYTSNNVSFLNNSSKINKYQVKFAENEEDFETKLRVNFNTKVVSLSKNGRTNRTHAVGIPYIKEFKSSKRIDASLLRTPKREDVKVRKAAKISKSIYFKGKKISKVMARITDMFKEIEEKLDEYGETCKQTFMVISENEDYSGKIDEILRIQRWIRQKICNFNKFE